MPPHLFKETGTLPGLNRTLTAVKRKRDRNLPEINAFYKYIEEDLVPHLVAGDLSRLPAWLSHSPFS